MSKDLNASQTLCHDPNGGLPRLLEIMARLRDPETGCPWDIEQTFASIARYTIEEAYEVADAIEQNGEAIGIVEGVIDVLEHHIFKGNPHLPAPLKAAASIE